MLFTLPPGRWVRQRRARTGLRHMRQGSASAGEPLVVVRVGPGRGRCRVSDLGEGVDGGVHPVGGVHAVAAPPRPRPRTATSTSPFGLPPPPPARGRRRYGSTAPARMASAIPTGRAPAPRSTTPTATSTVSPATDRVCPAVHEPVTATAHGSYEGVEIHWERTFPSNCELLRVIRRRLPLLTPPRTPPDGLSGPSGAPTAPALSAER